MQHPANMPLEVTCHVSDIKPRCYVSRGVLLVWGLVVPRTSVVVDRCGMERDTYMNPQWSSSITSIDHVRYGVGKVESW
jgi:hypothetical protein